MAIPIEYQGKFVYHFTHVENLESIIQNGLLSTNEKKKLGIPHRDIANGNIQERRSNMQVSCFPGGTVHDYVPFYFCSTNPMLLSLVNKKNIDQIHMVFLVIPIDKLLDPNVIFTDASANTHVPPSFFTDPACLSNLNWESIDSIKWGTRNDRDKHQKMAEVLVYNSLSINDVSSIIVWNDYIKNIVEDKLGKNNILTCNVSFQPFSRRYFYFTKFARNRGDETLTTGPEHLKRLYKITVQEISKKRKTQDNFKFKTLTNFIDAIKENFCVINELQGIYNLNSANELHKECVSDHTIKVVSKLEESKLFGYFAENEKQILLISAYLHDIGKGPKTVWKDGIQQIYPDHPVDSLKMLTRILVEDVEELSEYQIRMICLLVGYHDLMGEIFGKERDKKQLFDVLEDEKEFDMLNCLNYADVESFDNNWKSDYVVNASKLKKEFLEQLVK